MTVQIQRPDFVTDPDTGRIEPTVQQLSLHAKSFWLEYADRDVFGLEAEGMTAYLLDRVLYMDTGRAYALPKLDGIRKSARELALGLLVHGRVTKENGTYHIDMKTDALELHISVTADQTIQAVNLSAVTADETAITASLTPIQAPRPTMPQEVLDAMVRTKMEPPMALTEPLEVLLPALEQLIPLEGELSLGVECGILELSETVLLRMDESKAELERKGVTVTLDLPMSPAGLEPLPSALLLLRNGDFILDGQDARIRITLPPETSGALCAALVPQIEGLGMTFAEGEAELTITGGHIRTVTLHTGGEVPFLVTTIPLSFSAELKLP